MQSKRLSCQAAPQCGKGRVCGQMQRELALVPERLSSAGKMVGSLRSWGRVLDAHRTIASLTLHMG
eukprot:5906571-Amphidinium_carterae.1